jgi:hypothetical protein
MTWNINSLQLLLFLGEFIVMLSSTFSLKKSNNTFNQSSFRERDRSMLAVLVERRAN